MKLAVGVMVVALYLVTAEEISPQFEGSASFLTSVQPNSPSVWSHFLCTFSLSIGPTQQ